MPQTQGRSEGANAFRAKDSRESYSVTAKHYDAAYPVNQDLVDLPFYLKEAKALFDPSPNKVFVVSPVNQDIHCSAIGILKEAPAFHASSEEYVCSFRNELLLWAIVRTFPHTRQIYGRQPFRAPGLRSSATPDRP